MLGVFLRPTGVRKLALFSIALITCFSFIPSARAVESGQVVKEITSSGPGGVEFLDDCLSGFALNSLRGNPLTWRNTQAITQLKGNCAEIVGAGETLGSNSSYTGTYGLSISGTPNSITCPQDSVATGAIVFNTQGTIYVSGIKLICGDLPRGGNSTITKVLGQITASSEELRCPVNSLVTGVKVKYGEIVDSFGIRCAPIKDLDQQPLSSIIIEPTEKIYPYTAQVTIKNLEGGSGAGKATITAAKSREPNATCSISNGVVTANAAVICDLTITKDGDSLYGPITTKVPFEFRRANQSISITSIGDPASFNGFSGALLPVLSGAAGTGDVTYTVRDGTASGCSLSEPSSQGTLSAISAGTCIITATIGADENYESSTSPDFTFDFSNTNPMSATQSEQRGDIVLEKYDPVADSKNVVDFQVAAFALLALATSAGSSMLPGSSGNFQVRTSSGKKDDQQDDQDSGDQGNDKNIDGSNQRDSGDIASTSANKLSFYKRTSGLGDNSRLWRLRHTPKIENRFVELVEGSSSFSPVVARIFHDGSYLRAMLSGISIIPMLGALITSIFILFDTKFQALPASMTLMLIALGLSSCDALAGLALAAIVFIATIASGNVLTLDEAMTLIGISGLLLTPALIASSVRPLRRLINDSSSRWERLTDYFLAIIIGGWSVEKLVGALNGLAGVQLPISAHARTIGMAVSIFIFIRLILEDIATHFFPKRLSQQEANLRTPKGAQPIFSIFIKTSIFFLVSYQFLGFNQQLLMGTAIFVFPQLLNLALKNFPIRKSSIIGLLLPKGAPKLIAMVFVGGLFANWVQSQFAQPEEFITWSFVLLAIPGLALSLISMIAGNPRRDWKDGRLGTIVYRLGGVAVAILILLMYQGVDLYATAFGK